MTILALSTSGKTASAALINDEGFIDCISGDESKAHSETVMGVVDALLMANGIDIADVDCFAAETGPGSFTGVRIGVCAANAFAAACRKPVIGVTSLEALYRESGIPGAVCVLIDARNGNGYSAVFDNGECTEAPHACTVDSMMSARRAGVSVIGDGATAYANRIKEKLPDAKLPCGMSKVTARGVAIAAMEAYERGEASDMILPSYLRPSQAERVAAERAALAQ